jgi:hypothetical protein
MLQGPVPVFPALSSKIAPMDGTRGMRADHATPNDFIFVGQEPFIRPFWPHARCQHPRRLPPAAVATRRAAPTGIGSTARLPRTKPRRALARRGRSSCAPPSGREVDPAPAAVPQRADPPAPPQHHPPWRPPLCRARAPRLGPGRIVGSRIGAPSTLASPA